jgi:uncharacterized protein (DUF885 family)
MNKTRKITRRDTLLTMAGTAALALSPRSWAQGSAGAQLRALIEASDAAMLRLDPTPRVAPQWRNGAEPFIDPLSDRYRDAIERRLRRDREGLQRIDANALTEVERIAFDVFTHRTRRQIERLDSGIADIQRWVPLDSSFGLHIELPDYVAGTGAPFNSAEDYEAGVRRLTGFAIYLESLVTRSREGLRGGYLQSQIVVQKVIEQAAAMLALPRDATPFHAALQRFPASFSTAARARYMRQYSRAIEQRVLPAYGALRDFLSTDYLPRANSTPGRAALRDGERVYAFELDEHTTITSRASDVHRLGHSEVARIREQMNEVRGKLGFRGDLAAFFEFIRTDPQFYYTRPEDLIARMHEIERRIWDGMPSQFARRPRAPFAVRALPSLGAQRGTGYYRPGPPDGTTPGVLWFNMAMLNTRPIPTLETLTLHEGIPGHHYQITLALEDASLPPILRFGNLTAFSEGWGLYAESLGRDLGMFADPYQWFGHLDMAMLRAVRLVVDTGLHADGWPRQQAIDYMLANTSMAQRDVEVEVDRYIALPGQACAYKIGELQIRSLRERAAQAQGARFDIKAFHSQVLDTGALPLAVLAAKIERWLGAPA